MANSHGAFIWHELMTTDMKAAEAFYCNVVGWTCKDMQMPGMDYRIFSAGETMTAGLMNIPDEAMKMGAPPSWSGVVCVDDIDAAAGKVRTLGGNVIREPAEIPGVGRFGVFTDPQGAYFQMLQPSGPPPASTPPRGTRGRVDWNEFYAIDMDKAFPFYADMFGWTKGDALDMGPMGKYQLFNHNDVTIGGIMNKPPNVPVAAWGYYFQVGDIDAAVARVTAAGGRIVKGPVMVPGDDWIAQGMDPQGAIFALVGKRA